MARKERAPGKGTLLAEGKGRDGRRSAAASRRQRGEVSGASRRAAVRRSCGRAGGECEGERVPQDA